MVAAAYCISCPAGVAALYERSRGTRSLYIHISLFGYNTVAADFL